MKFKDVTKNARRDDRQRKLSGRNERIVVPGETVEIAEELEVESEDLSEKTAAELKAILKEKGLDVPARANKSELIKLIAEA